jgi:ABC-2 type transport system ATP-binding protein
MRQKVALAMALLHRPALLMLDEPLTGLDPRGIRTLYELLRRRAREGGAVMLSSHLLGQIEGLCTHLLIMREGRALFHGSAQALRAHFPGLGPDASLEELFFLAVEGGAP